MLTYIVRDETLSVAHHCQTMHESGGDVSAFAHRVSQYVLGCSNETIDIRESNHRARTSQKTPNQKLQFDTCHYILNTMPDKLKKQILSVQVQLFHRTSRTFEISLQVNDSLDMQRFM